VGTRDFDAAAEFYGGVLGLSLSKRWGEMPALHVAIHHRYAPS
jgi:catechol 2,3-dioxygenase-like lactoylglutathione lyase family enzyme